MTEEVLRDQISSYLDRYFYTEIEIKSNPYVRRIDILLIHKTDIENKYPIGIEVKRFEEKSGRDIGDWLKQAQDYSQLLWYSKRLKQTLGKALIIVAPQISGYVFEEGKLTHHDCHYVNGRPHQHHNVSTFLGQFNVGELQSYLFQEWQTKKDKKYYRIVYRGWIIWDQNGDVFNFNHYDKWCR
jgi:hypothetical protein